MRIQVFQGTGMEQFQTLQSEGKIFTVQPVTLDGRNLMTSLRNLNLPLQPIAQVVDDNNKVRGLCFATGNGVALSETGAGYAISYNGRESMTLKQSTEDGIGVAEIAEAPPGYAPSLSYPVEQVAQPTYNSPPQGQEQFYYPQPPYQSQQPGAPPPPYQQPSYQGQPYPQQMYPQQPAYQSGYDPTGFGAPLYPAPVPYVDYHEQQHLLQHYNGDQYSGYYGYGSGHGHHGDHNYMGHDEHHDDDD